MKILHVWGRLNQSWFYLAYVKKCHGLPKAYENYLIHLELALSVDLTFSKTSTICRIIGSIELITPQMVTFIDFPWPIDSSPCWVLNEIYLSYQLARFWSIPCTAAAHCQNPVWAENLSILHNFLRGIRFWHSQGLVPTKKDRNGKVKKLHCQN